MQEKNSDPGQSARSDQPSRQQTGGNENKRGARVCMTPARVMCGALVLALLIISIMSSLLASQRSYASANGGLNVQDTGTPTCLATPTAGAATPTTIPATNPSPTRPTPTPTRNPTPTPTPPPATPTPTPPPATPTPTPPTATATPSGQTSQFGKGTMQELSYIDCTPAATSTALVASPTAAGTSVSAGPGNNNGTSTPAKSGGNGMSVMMIIVGIVLLLLLCLGVGWLMFRRMLLPQAEVKLPPSGARPWSRTRAPNPDSLSGVSSMNMEQFNRNAAVAFGAPSNGNMPSPGGFEPFGNGVVPPSNSFTPNMQGFDGPQMNFPAPASNGYVPQGNSYGGFSDGFIPSSPQIFPQSESSMIPPGSGAFPVINNTNGFAPASSAFNAMYGLPGGPDLNDPHLDEVIRQYSQKGQPAQQQPQNGPQNPGRVQ